MNNVDQTEIEIDNKTQAMLKEINTEITMLQDKAKAILQTIINIRGLEGNWELMQDMSRMMRRTDQI